MIRCNINIIKHHISRKYTAPAGDVDVKNDLIFLHRDVNFVTGHARGDVS
jgi:hypothetical protein